MKKYIILTSSICNMGGAQMYVANKAAYYESLGWETSIYFFIKGEILINRLQHYSSNFKPELEYNIWSFSKARRERIIEDIISCTSEGDEVVIETNLFSLAFWGEAIAQKIKGKHVIFILQETIPILNKKEAEFFDFKLSRKELINSHSKTLKNIFKEYFKPEYHFYNYKLLAYCSNVIDYTSTNLPTTIVNADYNILSIGRLDKEYIKPMLNQIRSFVSTHSNKTFNLIFIGGDKSHIMNNYIKDYFREIINVNLSLLGYIFPVPYDWIKIADISIASSNSVLVTSERGIPTIAIDGRDFQAIGIHKHTTMNTVFRNSDEPKLEISSLMEDVLIKKIHTKTLTDSKLADDLKLFISPHYDLLNMSSKEKQYFDVLNIQTSYKQLTFKLKRIFRVIIKSLKIRL